MLGTRRLSTFIVGARDVELAPGASSKRRAISRSEIGIRPVEAFKEAAQKAKPVILEPIMRVEVIVPDQFMGDITGNLSGKRGQIEGMEERGLNKVVKAKVPLSEMFGYTTTLRSMTEGRGSMTMEFDHYDTVPNNVAADIIASRK